MSNVGDVEDMAKNAISILQDETVHQQFKKNALEQALKFDIHNIVPQYEAIYASVL
jgi:hypothetical protein